MSWLYDKTPWNGSKAYWDELQDLREYCNWITSRRFSSLDADDVFNEACLTALTSPVKTLPSAHHELKAWFRQVFNRTGFRLLRSQPKHPIQRLIVDPPDPNTRIARTTVASIRSILEVCIKDLSEFERNVVRARHLTTPTPKLHVLAESLGLSISTIHRAENSGIEKLLRCFERHGVDATAVN